MIEIMGKQILAIAVCALAFGCISSADTIRGINIEFVTIGNPGNAPDTDGTPGCGAVGYNYRIGKYEITNAQWDAFTAVAGAPTGNPSDAYDQSESATFTDSQQPANNISWYEAAQFCNYLTSDNKYLGAYKFDMNGNFLGIDRDSSISTFGTTYVIPTEDEWYKAAYYKTDGSIYSLYANGLDTIPPADNGWNYHDGVIYNDTWNVGTGTQEQNGTFDMMGNVQEWNETLKITKRGLRGGTFDSSWLNELASSGQRTDFYPTDEYRTIGFRIASIPEPCTLLLLGVGGVLIRRK